MRPWLAVLAVTLICGCPSAIADPRAAIGDNDFRAQFSGSLAVLPDQGTLNVRGSIYVPAYSRLPGRRTPVDLSTTLRVDNTSASKPLVVNRIDYFDTTGRLVQSFLDEPIALRPFGAIQVSVPAEDPRGGPAANFIVAWSGSGPIAEPLVEAVMLGSEGNASYSFVSRGRPIKAVGRSRWFDFGRPR
jgi:hypothetical protein